MRSGTCHGRFVDGESVALDHVQPAAGSFIQLRERGKAAPVALHAVTLRPRGAGRGSARPGPGPTS
jgi:hypothetical protein